MLSNERSLGNGPGELSFTAKDYDKALKAGQEQSSDADRDNVHAEFSPKSCHHD
jgi:hypothetical protein